jgi:hypothetical protein
MIKNPKNRKSRRKKKRKRIKMINKKRSELRVNLLILNPIVDSAVHR